MIAHPRDLLSEAARALLAHRLRATLSMIGIVFGVATVVTAIAIGQGARDAAVAEIGGLGVDNVFVRAAPAGKAAPVLTREDGEALAAAVPDTLAVAVSRIWRGDAAGPRGRAAAMLAGVTPSWREVARVRVDRGRWLQPADANAHRRVAVVGADLALALFGPADPVGASLSIGGSWFVIVGRLAGSGGVPATVQRIDRGRAVFVPIESMDVSLGQGDAPDRVVEIALSLSDVGAATRAVPLVLAVLARRRIDPARYEVIVPRELLNARLRAQRTFNAVLLAIGALALTISGIGIMNIMLASVAERTQEIGVRRAFGARRGEVVLQFALEAGLLCVIGGIAGVPLGWILSAAVASFAGWPTALSPSAVAMAVTLAVAVGLAFGVYPARVAASIDPAEALRAP